MNYLVFIIAGCVASLAVNVRILYRRIKMLERTLADHGIYE